MPEAADARRSPNTGEIAPMMMPKHTAPVPVKNNRPTVTTSTTADRTSVVSSSPAAIISVPIASTKPLDFFMATMPKTGWVTPYISWPTATAKLTSA